MSAAWSPVDAPSDLSEPMEFSGIETHREQSQLSYVGQKVCLH